MQCLSRIWDSHVECEGRLVVVHVDRAAVVDLVVLQRDVVLEDRVPPLQPDLVRPRPRVRRDQLLQVPDRVRRAAHCKLPALDPRLVPHAVVHDHLDHQRVPRRVLGVLYRPLVVLVHLVVHPVYHLHVRLRSRRRLELC